MCVCGGGGGGGGKEINANISMKIGTLFCVYWRRGGAGAERARNFMIFIFASLLNKAVANSFMSEPHFGRILSFMITGSKIVPLSICHFHFSACNTLCIQGHVSQITLLYVSSLSAKA